MTTDGEHVALVATTAPLRGISSKRSDGHARGVRTEGRRKREEGGCRKGREIGRSVRVHVVIVGYGQKEKYIDRVSLYVCVISVRIYNVRSLGRAREIWLGFNGRARTRTTKTQPKLTVVRCVWIIASRRDKRVVYTTDGWMDTHVGLDFRRPRFSCLSRCAAALTTLGRPPPVVLTLFSSRPTVLPRAPQARALALCRPFGPLPLSCCTFRPSGGNEF